MGAALAQAACDAGHDVTLLLGPCAVPAIDGVTIHRFETTAQLQQLLNETFVHADALIMAAAVADYRPTETVVGKLPRAADGSMTLTLVPTPDLVAELVRGEKRAGDQGGEDQCGGDQSSGNPSGGGKRADQRVVAFALEEAATLETRALEKMQRKGVDAIVANPLATMNAETITPVWLTATGLRMAPGVMQKTDFARWILERLGDLFSDEPNAE